MPRTFSFWLLLGLVSLFAVLLYHVIEPFIVAIFVGLVMAVLFAPFHQWLGRRVMDNGRWNAALTTGLAMVFVLLPISFTLLMAGSQLLRGGQQVVDWLEENSVDTLDDTMEHAERTELGARVAAAYRQLSSARKAQVRRVATRISEGAAAEMYAKTRGLLADLFTFVVSLCIVALTMYYILADRRLFMRHLHRTLPLQIEEERALNQSFERVCRGVVLGTVVAGVVQATLAGFAFAVLSVPQLWLLIVLSMFCSFIPFVGAAAVWGLVSVWLVFEGRVVAGIGLAVYGATVISTADNLVRAHVIGDQAKLHPLVSLITVLGAIKLMGLWGIFVGPMVAAILFALLNILRERFIQQNEPSPGGEGDPRGSSERQAGDEPYESTALTRVSHTH
jgi:predicted PurR-regulated permease PerM